ILHMKVRNTKGEITLPTKILELLPIRRFQRYLFTITSENRFTMRIEGYPSDVLVQAASIHNVLLGVNQ
ncbi:MAG: hypothetical protein QME52_14235, partial [Bacteroidota bacterium]|nr:hypothetical protein [Bacteroidota bacterium]